jgi:hypothetical protein
MYKEFFWVILQGHKTLHSLSQSILVTSGRQNTL